MSESAPIQEQRLPLWQFVPLSDYQLPTAGFGQTAGRGVARLWRRLRPPPEETESPFTPHEDLSALDADCLRRVAPAPQWRAAADALDEALEPWLQARKPGVSAVFVVGPPHSGRQHILQEWAALHKWRLLKSPKPEQILGGDASWSKQWAKDETAWVLPELEHCFLRHVDGLTLIRQLFNVLGSEHAGRVVIGCDSWAWAFLQHVWTGHKPAVLVCQALDDQRLAQWLVHLANPRRSRYIFRQSNDGRFVLPPAFDVQFSNGKPLASRSYAQRLAAHSRGIAGVALDYWRSSLSARPDEAAAPGVKDDAEETGHFTIWVTPWDEIRQPSLPADAGHDHAFLLHALLLHSGLSADVLTRILPFSLSRVVQMLYQLEDAELVAAEDAVWSVSGRGYPPVHAFLEREGYLVDAF